MKVTDGGQKGSSEAEAGERTSRRYDKEEEEDLHIYLIILLYSPHHC